MENSVFRISLDVHRQTTQEHLAVKKGDTARTIIASLSDGGKPYQVAEGCYAVFMAQKPDGNVLYNACRIENNRIVYDFTEQTVSAAGRMICELRLYGADDKVITSPKIAIIVSGTVYEDDEVESTSEFTALSQAMADVAELKKTGLKGDPGDNVELRYADHQVVWRYVMPEGEPEDEWKVLFSSDDVRDQVVQETLDEALGYAEAAAESAELANEIATSAQGYCSQVYEDCLGVKSSAEQSAQQAKEAVAAVPTKLPNPQKLVLTGAVKAEYDGSENVEVSIPAGSGVHVGADSPMNGEKIWYNPDEEPEGGGTVSPEAIKQAVGEYMAANPLKETDPTVPAWAKQPEKPKYTAAEVGALPADTVIPEGVTDEQIKNAVDAYLTENPPSGGCDNKPLELIRTVTIPADIATDMSGVKWTQSSTEPTKPCKWEISTDKNGEPFELKYLAIVYKSPNAASVADSPFVNLGNDISCSAIGLGVSEEAMRGGVFVWDGKILINSTLQALWMEPTLVTARLDSQPFVTIGNKKVTCMSVGFNTAVPYWTEGATFDIYGVRV